MGNVTDIRDMCAPGPMTNDRLLDRADPTKLKDKLRLKIDYIGVNARVWWLFSHVHGGGPTFCRDDLDIYSGEYIPELELYLDELRSSGSNREFSRNMSRQFVDECRGDVNLYDARYGRSHKTADGSNTDVGTGNSGAPAALQVEKPDPSELVDSAQF